MRNHGQPPSEVCQSARLPLKCYCSAEANSFAELCPACIAEYDAWLEEEAAAARLETIHMSAAQFFAACELFDEATTETVLTVRMVLAA